jgi:hypothetical protein
VCENCNFIKILIVQQIVVARFGRRPRLTCQRHKPPIPDLMPSRFYYHVLIILVSLISTRALHAATRTVKFAWKASPSAEVVGYKIFWGTGSHNYQDVRDVRNVLTTSLTLSQTKYYVAVTAYSMTTNSWFSNEVIVPP